MLFESRPDCFDLINQMLLRSALEMQDQRRGEGETDAVEGQQPSITADLHPLRSSLLSRLAHLIPHA